MPVTWVLDPPVFIPLPGVPLPPEGTILSELEVPDSYVVPEATLVVPNDVLLVPSFISTPVVAPVLELPGATVVPKTTLVVPVLLPVT